MGAVALANSGTLQLELIAGRVDELNVTGIEALDDNLDAIFRYLVAKT